MTPDSSSDGEDRDYTLTGLFDDVLANAQGGEVSIGEVVATFRRQAYGPLLLIPSIIALIPIIGGIPGVSVITALLIILVAAQMILGRRQPWLPQRLRRFSLSRKRVEQAVSRMRPYLEAIDRWTRPRLTMLSAPPLFLLIPVVCIGLALLMFPLALVPWGVTLPALALTFLSVGLTTRDGHLLAAGYAVTVVSVIAAVWIS